MDNRKVIYLDDAIEAVSEACFELRGVFGRCEAALKALPSVQERKKGRWMTDVAFYDEEGCPCIVTRCDKCGEVAEMTAYCPHCGAHMEGAEDETD